MVLGQSVAERRIQAVSFSASEQQTGGPEGVQSSAVSQYFSMTQTTSTVSIPAIPVEPEAPTPLVSNPTGSRKDPKPKERPELSPAAKFVLGATLGVAVLGILTMPFSFVGGMLFGALFGIGALALGLGLLEDKKAVEDEDAEVPEGDDVEQEDEESGGFLENLLESIFNPEKNKKPKAKTESTPEPIPQAVEEDENEFPGCFVEEPDLYSSPPHDSNGSSNEPKLYEGGHCSIDKSKTKPGQLPAQTAA